MTTVDNGAGTGKRILDVGQCSFDHRKITEQIGSRFGVAIDQAISLDEALKALKQTPYSLVLVNRLLDEDGSEGLDVIRAIKSESDPSVAGVPVMLVSNYPDAQKDAQAAGAIPGFGKAELSTPETVAKLEEALKAAD